MGEFSTLIVVATLAFLAPMVARRLHLPVVVGEIALGMIVGLVVFLVHHYGDTRLLAPGESIDFLAEIGLIILLFLAGLEVDFNMIEERGLLPLALAFGVFVVMLGLAWYLAVQVGFGFFTALILTTTSIGVVVPTLRETRVMATAYGQNVLITALLIDFGAMLLLTFYVYLHGQDGPTGASWAPFLFIPLLFVVFYAVYRLGGLIMWHYPQVLSKFFRGEDPTEGGVRASLALMFIFVGLSILVGIEAILGGFLAGILISLLFREGSLLTQKLYGFGYGFFVPLFFIHLGLTFRFDLVADPSVLLFTGTLFAILVIVKLVPNALWLPYYGPRRVIAMSLLNSSGLTLMIAAATVGIRLGLIDDGFFAAIIVLAVVTAALGPSLFRVLMQNDAIVQRRRPTEDVAEVRP